MLVNGATTLWERWEHATGSGMNSHNHPMLGSVGAWFFRTVAGIQADASGPGFARFDLRPHIDPHVGAARATLATVRGEIECNWQVEDRTFELVARVPVGSLARVFLPGEVDAPLLESSVAVWEHEQFIRSAQGIHSIHRQGDALICTIGSGIYRFRTTLPAEPHK
jgi:alpha-L-rhamnosidase